MNCPACQGEFEFAAANMYARCKKCLAVYLNMNGALTPYPMDESTRPMMEQALGFSPSRVEKFEAPKNCNHPLCQTGVLEKLEKDGTTYTRCPRCGMLSSMQGQFLIPLTVEAPGGDWDPDFQAIFEAELGFPKRVRKNRPGVVGP